MQNTVEVVLFNVAPQSVDIVLACAYLAARMQPWVAAIVLVTVSSYIPLTVCITERRGVVRKVGSSRTGQADVAGTRWPATRGQAANPRGAHGGCHTPRAHSAAHPPPPRAAPSHPYPRRPASLPLPPAPPPWSAHAPCALLPALQRMNALDNERESRVTDMLLNYETVKVRVWARGCPAQRNP